MKLTLWVNFFGNLKGVGVCQIGIRRRDGEDETAFLADELQKHVPDLDFNVRRLVTHRNFCHTRQIDQRQVKH